MPLNSNWLMLAIAATILALPLRVSTYSSGAPPESCYSMSAIHVDPLTNTTVPSIPCEGNNDCDGLTLTVTRNGLSDGHYSCNQYHQVTLHSTREFTGFLIQARVPVPGIPFHMYRIVGKFVSASPDVRIQQCNATVDSPTDRPQQNSATNSASTPLQNVTVNWQAPEPFTALGNIQFYATVIENLTQSYLLRSEELKPLNSTCEEYLPYIHLETTHGVKTEEILQEDDWSSDVIVIPGGFPFGTYNHTTVYIGTNGVFSFGYRELAYKFYLSNFERSTADPFWSDVDISNGVGEIKYEIHSSPSVLIDQVSSLISVKNDLQFEGMWMLVCYWENVPEYGLSLFTLNSFQGIIVTDGYRSFLVTIFKNGDIGWYNSNEARLGYYADESFQMFGPQDEATFSSIRFNTSSVQYYNEIYQLSIDGQEVALVQPELVEADIVIAQTSTNVTFKFDLAVDASTCDASQISLQTLDGRVTFTPMYAAKCVQVVPGFYHHEDNGDHIMTLTFHNTDHLRLLGKPYNQILQNNIVSISIGVDFVYTAARVHILPKFFIDGLTARIDFTTFIAPTISSLSLDLIRAEFRMKMNVPVNVSDLDNITISCGLTERVTLEGIFSTPDADHITQDILLHLSPYTFAAICCTLPCVEGGTAFLQSFTAFNDAFGNSVNPSVYTSALISVNNPLNCHLGVHADGLDYALLDVTEQELEPLGLYLNIQIPPLQCDVLYPLQNHEVYLHQCHPTVEVDAVTCLRLKTNVSNPQLEFTAHDSTMNVPMIEGSGMYIPTVHLNSSDIFGVFTCHSNEGYTVESIIARGETYLSPISNTHHENTFVTLGSYLELDFRVATCSTLDPKDIIVASSSMREPSVTNNNQNVHIQLGPLGSDDGGNVSILVPTKNQGYIEYSSIFRVEIEVPQVYAYIRGSPQLTVIVTVEDKFLATTLHCEPSINSPVIWFEERIGQPLTEVQPSINFILERNGQALSILNYDAKMNGTISFSCHLLNPSYNSTTFSVATFTIVTIPDVITISMDTSVLSGAVSGSYPHHTVFSRPASAESLVLPCLSGTGYGSLRWMSTISQFAGPLVEDSTSPYYSVTYEGSMAALVVHNYTMFSGSLTCYSEEAGLTNESVSVHISDDICMCYGSYSSPYPLSDCGGSAPPCRCPPAYAGDGVLCVLDSDNDGYPNVATLPSCDRDTNETFCKLDICPAFFNPDQSYITLEDIDEAESGVAYVFEDTLLPGSVVVSTDNAINMDLRCIGATGNTDIAVEIFELGTTNHSSYFFTCETETHLSISLSRGFEGAVKCQAGTTGNTAWMYFSTDACLCTTASVNTSVLPDFVRTCEKTGKTCDCTNSQCMCACGLVGDGVVCSTDSDGDSFPYPAISPLCAGGGTHTYCSVDNCHMDYNPEQDSKTCAALEDSEPNVCHAETDLLWGITWSDTYVGLYDTQTCSSENSSLGFANRLCLSDGMWSSEISTTCCSRVVFQDLLENVNEILAEEITNETQIQVEELITNLVDATTPLEDQSSLYPQDLGATNEIVEDTINVLLQAVQEDLLDQLNTEIVQVIDNVLQESNTEGWNQLGESSDGAENLLSNAELYGTYIVESIASSSVDVDLENGELTLNASFNNIFINAVVQDTANVNDVVFPVARENFTLKPQFGSPVANIRIPAELLKERAGNSNGSDIFTVNMVIENINKFLSSYAEIQETNQTVRAATQLIVSQIMTKNGTKGQEETFGTPAEFVFVTEELDNAENPRCAFWDFIKSQWSQVGVSTNNVTKSSNGRSYHVVCTSEHLTSFAVLVDVVEPNDQPNEKEAFALSIVSYVGCGISVCCLFLTIIFFLSYGKALFTTVHYFIHLNLAVALFLGYIAFAAGITTATQSRIACGIVAGLLHYLFLSVFCWMLCEGIMLYLMLVVVFSKLSKQWWLFLLIGWGLPVIVVGISVGAAYDQYGDPDNGYCWISVHQGAIWAFVAPMLAVISVNIFFFFATLWSLYKVSAGKYKQDRGNLIVVRKLLIAALILLPILGLTWVFGLLAVNENTTVFAWIFTIFNSLQGMFFFIFHVIRNDKVWKRLKRCFPVNRRPMKRLSSEQSKHTQSLILSTQGSTKKRLQKKPKRSGNKHKKENMCALSSDAVIVLENPLYDYPFGKKKDDDLALPTTMIV